MDDNNNDYGKLLLHVQELTKRSGLSKTKICKLTGIKHSQLNKYCKNDVVRIDFETLNKLCWVFKCNISDLLEYQEPKK